MNNEDAGNLLPRAAHPAEAGNTAPLSWTVAAAGALAQLPGGVGVVASMRPVSRTSVPMPMAHCPPEAGRPAQHVADFTRTEAATANCIFNTEIVFEDTNHKPLCCPDHPAPRSPPVCAVPWRYTTTLFLHSQECVSFPDLFNTALS